MQSCWESAADGDNDRPTIAVWYGIYASANMYIGMKRWVQECVQMPHACGTFDLKVNEPCFSMKPRRKQL